MNCILTRLLTSSRLHFFYVADTNNMLSQSLNQPRKVRSSSTRDRREYVSLGFEQHLRSQGVVLLAHPDSSTMYVRADLELRLHAKICMAVGKFHACVLACRRLFRLQSAATDHFLIAYRLRSSSVVEAKV